MWFRSLFKNVAEDARPASRHRRLAARLLLETLETRNLLSFNAAVNYPVGLNPQAPAAGLINADTAPDLAVANYSANSVSVLLNQGNGTFGAAASYAVGTSPLGVATGDFNGDGRADVVTANYAGNNVSVLLSQANGTLAPAVNYAAGAGPASVAVGDFNGDHKLDLAVANANGNNVSVLLGNGTGGFGAAQNFATGYNPRSVVAGDFDGDHKLDLATANNGGSNVSVLLGDGLGNFEAPRYSYLSGATSVAVGDVNHDGTLDLLAAGSVSYYYGGGGGCDPHGYGCWGGWGYTVTYGQANVLIGQGDGTFAGGSSFRLGYSVPYGIAAADFNGDGWDDFAVANGDVGGVSVFLNQGDGSFLWQSNLGTDYGPVGMTAADFNGDSRPDLAVANSGANSTSVLTNAADWLPWLRIEGATVTEGNSGTTNAVFTVRLWPNPSQPVTVGYTTVDGSAVAGSDYVAKSASLTFNPDGPLTQTIAVAVVGDTAAEVNEYFYVQLMDPVGATIANGNGYANIVDDEPYVTIDGYASVVEGNSGTTDMVFTLNLSAPSPDTVTVDFATADGDSYYYYYPPATAGSDYLPASGTASFAPNTTTQQIIVKVIGDTVGEWDEAFVVNLGNANHAHVYYYTQALGVIVDDEPQVSIGSTTVTEGDSGTVTASFTISLSAAPTVPVTVTYATADGSAMAGSDYAAATASVTFQPTGSLTQTITVQVQGDRLDEDDEYFYVNLTEATGALIAQGTGYATIYDNDAAPTLSINDVSRQEGDSGTTQFTFTVTLSTASGRGVSVYFNTADGSARVRDGDYVAQSGYLYFAPGDTSETISVAVKGDRRKESNETFLVKLTSAYNAGIADAQGIGTILDDDKRGPNK